MKSKIVNMLFVTGVFLIAITAEALGQEKKDTLYSNLIPEPQIPFTPRHYVCYKADKELIIDGKPDEAIWQNAAWTDYFLDIEGDVKPAPRLKTRAKMLWDDKYFYVAAELEEPDIWGKLVNRDDIIFRDNDFEIFIDPDGDTHNYYEFEMNALNTVWDLLLLKPYRDQNAVAVNAWDIKGLKTGVNIDGTINKAESVKDKKWSVEVAIPWSVLQECTQTPAPPKDTDQWRVNFSRVEWRVDTETSEYKKVIDTKTNKPYPENNWVWSPQGIVAMHYPEMWGFVQFSDKTAGSGAGQFQQKPEEAAKWQLRKIYYKERNYFAKNNRYTTDLNELGIEAADVPGYAGKPVIEITTDMFEVTLTSVSGKKIHISNDGRTW